MPESDDNRHFPFVMRKVDVEVRLSSPMRGSAEVEFHHDIWAFQS